ncbi:MAG: hypothetical protein U1E50_15845 [Caulobacteraceae bacterium]
MPFPRLHLVLRSLIIACGFSLAAMAGQAHAMSAGMVLAQQTTPGSECTGNSCTPVDCVGALDCSGGGGTGGGGQECPFEGGCGGEEYPPYSCDSNSACGGEENPFSEPNAVLPPEGLPLDLNIQPPEDEEGESKIVNAPITGSGNSDLIRGGGGSSNR